MTHLRKMMLEDLQRRNYAQPGALALLRNLRNMQEAGVDESQVLSGIEGLNTNGVWPFGFLAAAVTRAGPELTRNPLALLPIEL